MKNMEDEILNKKRTLSNQRKEISKLQFYESYNQLNPSYSSTAMIPINNNTNNYSHNNNNNLNSQFQINTNFEKENYPNYSDMRGNEQQHQQQYDFNISSFHSPLQQPQSQQQQSQRYDYTMNTTIPTSTTPIMKQNIDMSFIEQELYNAKKVMEVAKEELKKTSIIKKQSNTFIQNENIFLQNLRKK